MRYCINSASKIYPKGKLTEEGYGEFASSLRPPKVSKLNAQNLKTFSPLVTLPSNGRVARDFLQNGNAKSRVTSAENKGESDLLGNRIGGTTETSFPGIRVTGWEMVGGYAIQFRFSDGHNTGLFSYDLLMQLASQTHNQE